MMENREIAAPRAPDSGSERERPLVSVVIPCFNQGRFLAQAIDGALTQTWRPLEVIVVDDGSTDDTPAVIARYPGMVSLRQANQGPAAARNAGLRLSRGRYVLFLDADDFLVPKAIELSVHAIGAHPDYAFISGGYCEADQKGNPRGNPIFVEATGDPYLKLLRGCYIRMPATVLYRREVLERVGGFDPQVRTGEDYDLYLKIARQFPIGHFRGLMAYYRRHGDNSTHDVKRFFVGALEVLARQRQYFGTDPRREVAYRKGMVNHITYYFGRVFIQSLGRLRRRETRSEGLAGIIFLLRHPLWARYPLWRNGKSLLKRVVRMLPPSIGQWLIAHRPGRSLHPRI